MSKPVVKIRKGADSLGRPRWEWRCQVCPREKGRKPVGGDHRCSTFTSRNRGDRYPPAFERCRLAALEHVRDKHDWRVATARKIAAWRRETLRELAGPNA